jgi:site-specific recombinase
MPSPARAAVLKCLEGRAADSEAALELARLLDHFFDSKDVPGKTDTWMAIYFWLRGGGGRFWKERSPWPAIWGRLEFFLEVMEQNPEICQAYQESIIAILNQAQAVDFFAETGMPGDRGILPELWDCAMHWLLPQPRDDQNLTPILERLFRHKKTERRFRMVPEELFGRLIEVTMPGSQPRMRGAFADAFRILATRVQAQCFNRAMRSRFDPVHLNDIPAARLARASESLACAWLAREDTLPLSKEWIEAAEDTGSLLKKVVETMETEGVSVDLVHSIESVRLCLIRMDAMRRVMTSGDPAQHKQAVHSLLSDLVTAVRKERSLLHILSSRTALLHRKIVERAGETGTHYIAQNYRQYRHIWLAAAGGGLLTVGTAAVKLQIHEWHALPLFLQGLAAGLNYAVSFMILHAFHLILATKQPAMTAAHLARIIREKRGAERTSEIVGFAAQISYSQVAAALGNILLVAAGSCAFVYLWRQFFGAGFLPEADAAHVFETLSPLDSGTIFFAAWTGVLLWLASVIGGWFDNWSVYHRLPEGIRDHRLGRMVGSARMARCGAILRNNMNGWATNISLGMLLGLTPVFGAFFGVPLEVRHVTLSTGQLAIAAASLGPAWLVDGWFFRALAGIGVMFILNLSVSFLCSLFTAARAYQVSTREVAAVLWAIIRQALTSPRIFLLPPRDSSRIPSGQNRPSDAGDPTPG